MCNWCPRGLSSVHLCPLLHFTGSTSLPLLGIGMTVLSPSLWLEPPASPPHGVSLGLVIRDLQHTLLFRTETSKGKETAPPDPLPHHAKMDVWQGYTKTQHGINHCHTTVLRPERQQYPHCSYHSWLSSVPRRPDYSALFYTNPFHSIGLHWSEQWSWWFGIHNTEICINTLQSAAGLLTARGAYRV